MFHDEDFGDEEEFEEPFYDPEPYDGEEDHPEENNDIEYPIPNYDYEDPHDGEPWNDDLDCREEDLDDMIGDSDD